MIELFIFGFFFTYTHADGVADVVLTCSLVEEGVGLGEVGGGAHFTRTPATLVLRDVAVGPEEPLEMLTSFVPPAYIDPELILLEASVTSPEIPNADQLLHADCNDLEVTCEMSRYSPRRLQDRADLTYFIVSISVEGLDFSTSLILETIPVEKDQPSRLQRKLNLPLSQSGTLLTKVIFVVFSNIKSVSSPLRGDAILSCGYKQQDIAIADEVGVEWRLQHRGKGWKVLEMKTALNDTGGNADVLVERKGSSINPIQAVSDGNVSLTLTGLRVADEGTYICTVTLGHFHSQQVIQLKVTKPPHVSLSEDRLVLDVKSRQTVKCLCSQYYPLDAQMEWLFISPTGSEPEPFRDQGSLTSHRQHGDKTYSMSSHLTIPPSVSPGTKIICRVSHAALDAPLDVSLMIESPVVESYWWFVGFLIITILFFYQVMR